ncbi:MAG: ABC transporter ATPase [Clostridiaceae bacterium]
MPEQNTRKLATIQKRNCLNEVFAVGPVDPAGARSKYHVIRPDEPHQTGEFISEVQFQQGPRTDPEATTGVTDTDLLEMVRDRLQAFQDGTYSCRENGQALDHIEAALLYLNKRTEDRADRGVLGTQQA